MTHPGETPLEFYPQSREFAKEQFLANPKYHETHNYCHEPLMLKIDPRTRDRDALLRDKELCVPYKTPRELAGRHAATQDNDAK